MSKQVEENINVEKQYDGSEMDEIKSPPFKMIGVFLIITAVGFLYTYIWSLAMSL